MSVPGPDCLVLADTASMKHVSPAVWTVATEWSLGHVLDWRFFTPFADLLRVGDQIFVTASTTSATCEHALLVVDDVREFSVAVDLVEFTTDTPPLAA